MMQPAAGKQLGCIAITGARGYIGSALAARLADAGYALRLVSRVADVPDTKAAENVDNIAADLCDERSWSELLAGCGTVVHLSSRTDLRAAEADPAGDDAINVEPLRALIRAAENADAPPKVVFASTVTIVGVEHDNPVDEKTPDNPISVYDQHKLACETLLREATQRGVLRACSLRLSNVYGYGRGSINANRGILNAMIGRAIEGGALTIFGPGLYLRDFVHLGDVVEAFQAALTFEGVCDGSHYVIASGEGHTLAEAFDYIAQEALRGLGSRIEIRHVPEPADLHPIERRNFVGDWKSFNKLTGWRPRTNLPAGIRDYFNHATASVSG
jgi:nucleoside-diphosphate-sugar epimerase